jgi:hypothetical protein
MIPQINNYIEKRYNSWLDYSTYHCSNAGMIGQENDVLDEVILALLQKENHLLKKLFDSKKIQKGKEYTQLDFFVLQMIKLNIYSPTSPYQSRFKPIPKANKDLKRLNIEDVCEEDEDQPAQILKRFDQVREAFESLNLSPKAKLIFEYKFFQDQAFSDWPGTETKKQLYEIYSHVSSLIRAKIFKKTLL